MKARIKAYVHSAFGQASVASSGQGGEQQEGSVLFLESTEAKGNNSGHCIEAGCSGSRVGNLCHHTLWELLPAPRQLCHLHPDKSDPPWC